MRYILLLTSLLFTFCRLEEEPAVVVAPPVVAPTDPMEELWRFLRTKRLYTKSYEDFQQQFPTKERLELLLKKLVEDKHIKGQTVDELLKPYEAYWKRMELEAQIERQKSEEVKRIEEQQGIH